jgi:hypothetical protein
LCEGAARKALAGRAVRVGDGDDPVRPDLRRLRCYAVAEHVFLAIGVEIASNDPQTAIAPLGRSSELPRVWKDARRITSG